MKKKSWLTISIFAVTVMFGGISTAAQSQSLDELYKVALKEGGTLNFYGTLAQINAERILPVFEKRFPGIKVNHVRARSGNCRGRDRYADDRDTVKHRGYLL